MKSINELTNKDSETLATILKYDIPDAEGVKEELIECYNSDIEGLMLGKYMPIKLFFKGLYWLSEQGYSLSELIKNIGVEADLEFYPKEIQRLKTELDKANAAASHSKKISKEELEKLAWHEWEVVNNQLRDKGGVNPTPYVLGFKDGYSCATPALPSARVVEALKGGIKLVMDERKRQIEVEKFDYEHDEDYKNGELIGAAGCYVANALSKHREDKSKTNQKPLARFQYYDFGELDFLVNSGDRGDRRVRQAGWVDGWPWDAQFDKRKKHDKIRSLVIGAALIIAHLDKELAALSTVSDEVGKGYSMEIPLENIFKSPLSTTVSRTFWKKFFTENNFKVIKSC